MTKRITQDEPARQKRDPIVIPGTDTPLTQAYASQIAAYYSLPQVRWPKRSLTFSPSSAGECSRRLYYELTNAEQDPPKAQIPWQARLPRVGDGLHHVNQQDAVKMPSVLLEKGIQPSWRVKTLENGKPAIEADFKRTFTVDDVEVTIKGRVDAILQFINADGEVTDEAVLDYKIKGQMKKLAPSSIVREVDKYSPQMIAYSLLTDIGNILIEFESAQKPDWKDGADAKDDERYVHLVPTDEERTALLQKFAHIIRCIRDEVVPDAERSYSCNFCPFTQICNRHGD